MGNIIFLLGTGPVGEDVLHKEPIVRYLKNRGHKIYIISRINPNYFVTPPNRKLLNYFMGTEAYERYIRLFNYIIDNSEEFIFIYDIPELNRRYSPSEIERLENWLGVPFSYIASLDRRFYNKHKNSDRRERINLMNFLAGLVELYRNYFIRKRIDILINTLEDDIFSVTAYYVAKKLGITFVGIDPSRFPKKGIMLTKDFSEVIVWNKNTNSTFEDVLSLYDETTIVGKETIERTKSLFKTSYMLKKLKQLWGYSMLYRSIIKAFPYEQNILEPPLKSIPKTALKILRYLMVRKIVQDPDLNKNYFLFPLHYLDDAQITFREPFIDQFELIRHISRSLPQGYYLYVKPHPHYMGTDVSLRELWKISKLRNVKVINPLIPPIRLIKYAKGVITINSTTGFEALIFGKPVITFGHDFYCQEDIAYVVRDLNKLPEYIMLAITKGQKNPDLVRDFVRKVYLNTIWIDSISLSEIFPVFALSDMDGKRVGKVLEKILNVDGLKEVCNDVCPSQFKN